MRKDPEMKEDRKVFAFRLAAKKPLATKWRMRDGVSVAGCTQIFDNHYLDGPRFDPDSGWPC